MAHPYGGPGGQVYPQGSMPKQPSAPENPATGPSYPPQGQGYPGQSHGYQAPGQAYPSPGQGYPGAAPGYHAPQAYAGYPAAPGQTYQGQGYQQGPPAHGYPAPGQTYPGGGGQAQGYQPGPPAHGYPAPGQTYPGGGGQGQGYQPGPAFPAAGSPGYPLHPGPGHPAAGGQGVPPGGYSAPGLPSQQNIPGYPGAEPGYPASGPSSAAQGHPGHQGLPTGPEVDINLDDHVLMTINLTFDATEPIDSPRNASRKRILNDIIRSKNPSIICTQECPGNLLNEAHLQKGYVQHLKIAAELPGKFVYNSSQVMVVQEYGCKPVEEIIKEELGEEGNGLFAEHFRSVHPEQCDFQLVVVNLYGDQRKLSDKKRRDQLGLLFDAITNLKKHEKYRAVPIVIGGDFGLRRSKWLDHSEVTYWDYTAQRKGGDMKMTDMIVTSKDISLRNVQALNLRREDRELVPHDVVYGRIASILLPLPFHESHSDSITLDLHNEIATREVKKCDRAYVFTQRPLELGEVLKVQILSYDDRRKNNLIYGLTSVDPNEMNDGDHPDPDELFDDDNLEWIAVELEDAQEDVEISIHLSPSGMLRLHLDVERDASVDSDKIEVDPGVDWWAFFNMIGKTVELRTLGSYIVDEKVEERLEEEDLAEEEEWEDEDESTEEEYSEEEENPRRRGRRH